MRLIDADELKEAMNEHTDYKGYLVCDPEEIIDLAPTVERPQWIPCSERLPEAGTPVIFCNHHGEVTFGERFRTQGKAFIDFFTSNLTYATAWMPLPKPYEKEGDIDG